MKDREELPESIQELAKAIANAAVHALDESAWRVETIETHISWIFRTPSIVYKVKKNLANPFLDYSTLDRRAHFCREELRLNRRFARGLYLDVVAFHREDGQLVLGDGKNNCEYAVKMHRFPDDALLSNRLESDQVTPQEIIDLAKHVADFHRDALQSLWDTDYGTPQVILKESLDNFDALQQVQDEDGHKLERLKKWTLAEHARDQAKFAGRKQKGYIRECHGDMHAGNIVLWKGELTLFDGIEFNESFRWIDLISDVAFLLMDLHARDHVGLANLFISAYLENAGDYEALALLKWYMIYRALVRAKVAGIAMSQHSAETKEFEQAENDRSKYISLAHQRLRQLQPRLWITHGLSGSGKSTGANRVVEEHGAIRIRADVERKRLAGLNPWDRPTPAQSASLYSVAMTDRTYEHLLQLARGILEAGYSVIVDATFLKHAQRSKFLALAQELAVSYSILDFQAPPEVLEQRIQTRHASKQDASDATIDVLHAQIASDEPFDTVEQPYVTPHEVVCSPRP